MNDIDYEAIIAALPKSNKRLGEALIRHLMQDNTEGVLAALTVYQNADGGFGHGLEGDIRMPYSCVAATDVAMSILDDLADEDKKRPMIEAMIGYLEDQYDEQTMSWEIVGKHVDEFPRAVWWNYEGIDGFTYGNPNPEVAGFLYRYRATVSRIDVLALVEHVVQYINTTPAERIQMHSLISMMKFYRRTDEAIRSRIRDKLAALVSLRGAFDPNQWSEYVLEPYMIALIAPDFIRGHETALAANMAYRKDLLLKNGLPKPAWQWHQYDDVFAEVKDEWVAHITYGILSAIQNYGKQ